MFCFRNDLFNVTQGMLVQKGVITQLWELGCMYMKEARAILNAVYFGKLRLSQLMLRVTYANILGFSSQYFVSS